MADYTLANVRKLTKGVKTIFNDAMSAPKKEYLDVATEVNTNSHTVDYSWLGDLPTMREWIDERVFKKLKDYVYTIAKKDWEASIYVMRDDFLFDNLAIVKPKVQQLAHSTIRHYNRLVFGLIPLNGTCFDGQPFFGTHTLGNTEYKNITDAPLAEDSLFAGIEFMQSINDTEGNPLDISPNLLMVAPDIFKVAKKLVGSAQIDGSDNIAHKVVELKVVKQMEPGSWCLIDNTQPLKPFLLQITKKGEIEEDTSDMFKTKRINYGIDTMDNVGYGFWQMAYFSSGKKGSKKTANPKSTTANPKATTAATGA